jgi:lipopolysaccharide export system permease protein
VAFKNFGLNNTKVLKLISFTSLLIGILVITVFYNISANMKNLYLEIKNEYTKDNKYLAAITENGLWIKDEINENINIVNAEKIDENKLINVDILQFDKNFSLLQIIYASEVDITNNNWHMNNAIFSEYDSLERRVKNLEFQSNFNYEKINSLFSNLSSLNLFALNKIKKDYVSMNYSTTEINSHIQKIFSYPIYLMIMTILSATIMMNIKYDKPRVFHLIFGILLSVIIYYINYFLSVLGKSEKIPITVSIWMPIILLIIISSIGLIRINEK